MRSSNPTQPLILADPLLGMRLGEYEVIEAIGEGGMGVVYRGVQPVIKKRVAIKVLKPSVAEDASQVRRLRDEAEAVNSIGHRNIIDIFSLGQLPDGRPYIVMEYLEGEPLDAYVSNRPRLGTGEVLSLIIAICSPLAAAHRASVIHRDLKPSNIFVCLSADQERYLKLLDFGLAKKATSFGGSTEQTSRATVTGTPNYMAPEQARGHSVSARTDVYALGVLAYELLTGELPFSGAGPVEVLMQHVSAPIPSARALAPHLPPGVDRLITRMLAKRAEDRPLVDEVRATLITEARALGPVEAFETLDPVSGGHPTLRPLMTPAHSAPAIEVMPGDTLLSQRTLRPSRWPWASAALVVVIAALVAALALTSEPAPPLPVAVAPPPVIVPASPPLVVTPPAPIPVPVAAPVVAPVPEVVPPEKVPAPKTRPSEPQTALALQARVGQLELAVARTTPAGEEPDPTALTLLRKYRVDATMVSTPDERQRLARNLDTFERTFLKR